MNKLECIILTSIIFLNSLLYATLMYAGINYNIYIQSNSWNIIKMISLLYVVILLFKDIYISKKISRKLIISFFIIFVIIVINITFQIITFGFLNSLLSQDIMIFGSRGLVVFLTGFLLNKRVNIKNFHNSVQLITIYVSIAIIISFFSDTYRIGNRTAFAGVNYQTAAYVSALMFGLNLYFTFVKKEDLSKKINKKFISLLHGGFSVILFLNTLLTGGRGGVVVIVLYLLLLMYILIVNRKFKKIFSLTILAMTVSVAFLNFTNDDQFLLGLERAFSFIGGENGVIDFQNSNRDNVYTSTILHILQSPIKGYGFGSYYSILGFFPHNLFLQVLFEGGVFFLGLVVLFFHYLFKKLKRMVQLDTNNLIVIFVVLTNFTLLMFSSTYLRDDISWFLYGFVLSEGYKKIEIHNTEKQF